MTDSEKCVFCGCDDEALETHWPCPALPAPQPDPTDGIVVDPEAERYSERVTLRVPKSLTDAIETLVERGAYATRSQALRAAAFEAFVSRARERPATSMQVVPDGGVVASNTRSRRCCDRALSSSNASTERSYPASSVGEGTDEP